MVDLEGRSRSDEIPTGSILGGAIRVSWSLYMCVYIFYVSYCRTIFHQRDTLTFWLPCYEFWFLANGFARVKYAACNKASTGEINF